MGLLDDIRLDVGDYSPSGTNIAIAQAPVSSFNNVITYLTNIRVDVGDDEGVFPSGTNQAIQVTDVASGVVATIADLRVDIADDDGVLFISPTGQSIQQVQLLADDLLSMVVDLRIDVADDEGLDLSRIIVINPDTIAEAPEVWGTAIATSGTYDMIAEDVIILIDPSPASPVTINMYSTPIVGQFVIIKDKLGQAFINNITVLGAPSTIDGRAGFILTQNYQSLMLVWNGVEWNVV